MASAYGRIPRPSSGRPWTAFETLTGEHQTWQAPELFTVGQGTVAQVDVHPREVFCPLVRMRAHSCIIAHNHPSGDPTPSDADIHLTSRLVEVGTLLGVPVLDHLVLAGRRLHEPRVDRTVTRRAELTT